MTTTKTYNGWTNYETWNAKLWMDNDEGSYRMWQGTAQQIYDEAEADETFDRAERAVLNLSKCLKIEHEEACPDLGASMWADLLSAALSEVNWHEIAEHLIEDVDRGDETEAD